MRTPTLKVAKAIDAAFALASREGRGFNLAETRADVVERLTARMTELDAEITENAREPWRKPE